MFVQLTCHSTGLPILIRPGQIEAVAPVIGDDTALDTDTGLVPVITSVMLKSTHALHVRETVRTVALIIGLTLHSPGLDAEIAFAEREFTDDMGGAA